MIVSDNDESMAIEFVVFVYALVINLKILSIEASAPSSSGAFGIYFTSSFRKCLILDKVTSRNYGSLKRNQNRAESAYQE